MNDERAESLPRWRTVLPPHNSYEVAAARRQRESSSYQLPLAAATASVSANPPRSASSVPLRSWIAHVLTCIGGSKSAALSSPAYLGAALKIAASLSEQIAKAEKLADWGVRDQLYSLDTLRAANWADCVLVQLKVSSPGGVDPQHTSIDHVDSNEQVDDIDEKLRAGLFNDSFGSLGIEDDANDSSRADLLVASVANGPGSESGDVDARFEAFLESFQAAAEAAKQRRMPATKNNRDQAEAKQPLSALENHNSHRISVEMDQYSHQLDASANTTSVNSAAPAVADAKTSSCCEKLELDYLHVESALIQHASTERGSSHDSVNTAKEKAQRIYFLGLLFYQLFTGGEAPPAKLFNLASMNNAFVSLSTMTLVKMTDRMQNNAANSSKRHQGPQKAIGLCQLSCEYLRLIGIVSPICQLIFNMLDVIYGDFGGNECYSTMAEVVFDLQLMIDKPSKFLCGLDMDSTSLASQLNEMQIPRDQELQTILSCHRKCLEGSCEIAIIQGESGSGKSWVSQNVRRIVTSMGGIFLTGKFNYQMNQVKPFSALASAFDQYCDLILETNWVKLIAIQLQTALGQDACHLINVIPKLGLVIEDDAHHTASVLDIDCKNSIQRLHHLFCQFLEVIATNAQVSLTLCLDDIQWADEASIAVLTRLLMQQNGKFFFLGCCRGDEMESDHSFWKMLEAVNIAPRGVTTIQLKGIGDEVLNGVVSDLLSLSPRLVRPLSRIIHSKTRGNILFFSQLMLSLHREGLIYLDFSKERWTWNEEKILSMKLAENVAICFTNGINKLPNDLQSALHTLSLFSASARVEYLELLESQLGLNLAEPLTRAAAEGLVIKQGGHYHFCHDCIQEASYKMTCGKFRGSNHLIYGKCLVKHAAEKIDDGMLFTAVNQINLAGPSVISETGEYHTIANYNLIVGKKAMAMSAFASAYSFFKHGIAILLLEKNHWELHYKFSIEIFELAMKSSLAAGRLCGVEIYSNQLLKHAKCFADTLNTHFIVMLSLSYSSTLKAVEKGIDIVSKLGEEMTIHPSTEVLDYHIKHTQLLIRGVSEEQLLNHRMMTNSNKLAIMKFLARLQSIAFVIKPEVHKLVIMKMVQLTMTDGLSSHSAFGFASFGSFLSKLGNLNAGECHRFIVLSKSLLGKFDVNETSGELIAVVAEVQAYFEPLLAANELRVQGEAVAISEGNMFWACLCRLQYCADSLWAGTHLSTLQEKVSTSLTFIQRNEHKIIWGLMLILERTVNILLGKETAKISLAELSESFKVNTNARHEMILGFHNLYLSLLLNDGSVKESCELYLQKETKGCFLMSADAVQAFCVGLAAFQIYRQTRAVSWLEKGRSRIKDMKLWVEQGSSWNFKQKLLLMQAEEHYSNGDLQSAAESYKNAISFAKQHKFLNDESLAYELAARFYLGVGKQKLSLEHFSLAHETYIAWGAVGKANCLFQYINSIFASKQQAT